MNPETVKDLVFNAEGQCETYTYDESFSIGITIGDRKKYATGPDEYGYFAYDLYDSYTLRNPEFQWFEIAPPGPGELLTEITNADADTVTVLLPFTFRFYGIDYNSVGICSNGFLEMGSSTYRFGDNTGIPSLGGPKRLIAPFWDDLDPGEGGDIYTYFDQQNHRWILEFNNVVHYGGSSPETFQAVLLDPQYYPTPTGDGEILLLYKDVSDPSSCTVGIEDHSQLIGLEYLFDNDYDREAHELRDSFAILFSTNPPETRFPIKSKIEVSSQGAEKPLSKGGDADGVPNFVTKFIGVIPNPLLSKAKIEFSLNSPQRVDLLLFDAQGRLQKRIFSGNLSSGFHVITMTSQNIPTGVFFIQMRTDGYVSTKPLLILP